LPQPHPAQPNPARLGGLLIGLACLGSGIALAAGRQALLQLVPAPTPTTGKASLERTRYWSVDPSRRRDAALLLSSQTGPSPAQTLRLLRNQGWGQDPLAAVALKQSALAAEAAGDPNQAISLWRQLLERFPQQPASADALYALGRSTPHLRQQLLTTFPAHPAALAAAVDSRAALHLARWGPRWPGAEPLLRQACRQAKPTLPAAERQALSGALAQLGDGQAARQCLGATPPTAALQLQLAQALLKGNADDKTTAEATLLELTRRWPTSPEAREATALLAQQQEPGALQRLSQLPAALQDTAAVQARLALEGQRPWQGVLQRWPADPASWDLQWDLARDALLKRQWGQAATILASLNIKQLPAPLAARQLFWQGYSADALGNRSAAEAFWTQLQQVSPAGYYGWRGGVRLGQHSELDPRSTPATAEANNQAITWQPLASGDPELDALWRLGQPLEAWETWRHRQGGRAPQGGEQLLLEGRLRTGVGDDWTGLGQLELANLRLPQASCAVQWQRDQQLHPLRYSDAFAQAANDAAIDPSLLLGVAKQESRFSAGVASPVGAVGLLQLMPATASELAGKAMEAAALRDPQRNARLGARYLRQLLDQWQGNSFLAIASYNAGPGAVQSWLSNDKPNPQTEPELWTEAIPYPETRLYTKKVLGNLWTYRRLQQPGC
jgi:soluble lytic murein transglycosylase